MDKIDMKILIELDKNPKMQLTQLAKKVLISQQVADYRVKKLTENGTISKFGTIINLKSLGQEHYRVFFTFNARNEFTYDKIFDYLKKDKGVYWAARIGGKYDLIVTLFVYDFEELDKFIDRFSNTFNNLIKDYKSCYGLEYTLFKHKFISEDQNSYKYGYNDKVKVIDDLDRFILSKLSTNCRISALELGKERKISYKTVINRIKALEKEKIILGYRLFIKTEELSPSIILLSFKDYSKKSENSLLENLSSKLQVTQVTRMFGLWNLLINLREKNNEKLQDFLINLRDKFNIIDNYEIIPIFEDISINLMPL